jgi:hypothetical protein
VFLGAGEFPVAVEDPTAQRVGAVERLPGTAGVLRLQLQLIGSKDAS